MTKQLELFKSKSSLGLGKKLNTMDSKAKREEKKLKLNNEYLQETLAFKEKKISELQEEIDRMKSLIKVDSENFKYDPKYINLKMEEK